ncbi:MAG: hypothetical protein AAGA03_11620, partial [Planctomycetota bacterium]
MNEVEAEPLTFLEMVAQALGPVYGLAMVTSGFVCCLLALLILIRGRGPLASAALILVVPVPFLIGLTAGFQGCLQSFLLVAT